MKSITFNVSFASDLLRSMDRVAKSEARSRSELLREAVRAYVERKLRWKKVFSFWQREARRSGLKSSDASKMVHEVRSRRRAA